MKHFPGRHTWATTSEVTTRATGYLRIGSVRVNVVMKPKTTKQQKCKCGKRRVVETCQ